MSELFSKYKINKIKEYTTHLQDYRCRIAELNMLIDDMNKSKTKDKLIERRNKLESYQKNTQLNLLNYVGGEHFYGTWEPIEPDNK